MEEKAVKKILIKPGCFHVMLTEISPKPSQHDAARLPAHSKWVFVTGPLDGKNGFPPQGLRVNLH